MPNRKKLFTKGNSTKFVLYTEGRDDEGNKIKENVLIPVTSNHVPGNSLLISHIASLYKDSEAEKRGKEILDKKASKSKKKKSENDKEPDLNTIMGQMEDSGDEAETDESDIEDYDALLRKMEKMFNLGPSSSHPNSNVQVEVFEEDSDFSDEFGQFSDAETCSDFEDEDCKPRSILKCARPDCPEDIKMLNEGFEKVLAEYDDNQIGALDDEEIGGTFTAENEHVMKLISTPFRKDDVQVDIGDVDENLKKKILLYTEVEEPEKFVQITTEEKKIEFDCESILSTYSNKYNHPVTIKEESKIRKIRIPHNPLKKTLTKSQLKQLDEVSESDTEEDEEEDAISVATSFNIRPKGETPEQRKERKALFKEAKRESRILKKENKLAFKNEKKVQKANAMNIRNNIGIKLP